VRHPSEKRKESRHAWLLLVTVGLLNLAGGVWMFTQPDDGSRGGRLHLTMTEWVCLSLVTGTALVIFGLRKRRGREGTTAPERGASPLR